MEQFKVGDKVQVNQENYVEYEMDANDKIYDVPFPTTDVWTIIADLGEGNVRIQNLTNPNFPAPYYGNAIRVFRTSFLKKYEEK